MSFNQLGENEKNFLLQIYNSTKGDTSVQVSMYDIGAALDLDRDAASKLAEELIGWELVEIRTLSGGIGICAGAVSEIEEAGIAESHAQETIGSLGNEPAIDGDTRRAVERISADIKEQAGSFGLKFDLLSELMADLKTIDVQLDSPRPKTAIIRECLKSLKDLLETAGADKCLVGVKALLKE
jgi:hypothetical protein